VDPATARDRVRTEREAAPAGTDNPAPVVLFKDLATEYIDRHCKMKKKSWKQDVYWIDAELRPHWNDRPVATIKRRDVAQLLDMIADPPRNAPASSDHVRAWTKAFQFRRRKPTDTHQHPQFLIDGGRNQDLLIERAQEIETTDPREAENGGGGGDNDQRRARASIVSRSSRNSSMP
jgi:hypothetical protein